MTTIMHENFFPPNPLPSQMEFPPKTAEIKPTGIEDTKVPTGTMDNSLQGKRVAPDIGEMVWCTSLQMCLYLSKINAVYKGLRTHV